MVLNPMSSMPFWVCSVSSSVLNGGRSSSADEVELEGWDGGMMVVGITLSGLFKDDEDGTGSSNAVGSLNDAIVERGVKPGDRQLKIPSGGKQIGTNVAHQRLQANLDTCDPHTSQAEKSGTKQWGNVMIRWTHDGACRSKERRHLPSSAKRIQDEVSVGAAVPEPWKV